MRGVGTVLAPIFSVLATVGPVVATDAGRSIADLSRSAGKTRAFDLLNQPDVGARAGKLLGRHLDRLNRALQVGETNVVVDGRYVVGQGCQPHACDEARATLVVDTRTGRVLASIADRDGRLVRPDRGSWPASVLSLVSRWDDAVVAETGKNGPDREPEQADDAGVVDLGTIDGRVVYDHNGSEVLVDRRKGLIVYARPRSALTDAGVAPGQVLFRGQIPDRGTVVGTAFVFRRGCTPAPYAVSGTTTEAPDGTAMVLKGSPPRRSGPGCGVATGRRDDPRATLRFRFLSSP